MSAMHRQRISWGTLGHAMSLHEQRLLESFYIQVISTLNTRRLSWMIGSGDQGFGMDLGISAPAPVLHEAGCGLRPGCSGRYSISSPKPPGWRSPSPSGPHSTAWDRGEGFSPCPAPHTPALLCAPAFVLLPAPPYAAGHGVSAPTRPAAASPQLWATALGSGPTVWYHLHA